MRLADLVLEGSPSDFESFFVKATDLDSSLAVYAASRDQLPRLLKGVAGLPGLYVLQAEDSTVYVGKSVDLANRLKTHRTNDKIGYCRVLVVARDQGFARYVDYGEAALYVRLLGMGFRLEQSSLAASLDTKRQRLAEHVGTADRLLDNFLRYAIALGLTKPAAKKAREPDVKVPDPGDKDGKGRKDPPVDSAGLEFRVVKAGGAEIKGETAADTFVQAIKDAGLERVRSLDWTFNGEPLVADTQSKTYRSASKAAGSFFVMTHSNTKAKVRLLRRLSDALGLNWRVEGPGSELFEAQ